MEKCKVRKTLEELRYSDQEPIGFINRLFQGQQFIDYYDFMDRVSLRENQYIFCDHEIIKKFMTQLDRRGKSAVAGRCKVFHEEVDLEDSILAISPIETNYPESPAAATNNSNGNQLKTTKYLNISVNMLEG